MVPVSEMQRFSLFYAIVFGSIGAIMPFAAVWMDSVGISTAMIGIIVAAPALAMLLTTIALGRWADSLRDRRLAIISCNGVILLVQLVLFFKTDSTVVLLVWLISGIAMHAMIPITDAAALSLTHRLGGDFARVRAFGSIGFVVALAVAGFAYEDWGISIFVVLLLWANVLRLICALYLPAMPQNHGLPERKEQGSGGNPSLFIPGVILVLTAGALINASHAMVYTYGILLWTEQGMSEALAGMAFGVGVVVEIGLMWWFKSLTHNISARVCLFIAAACGIFRWTVLAAGSSIVMIFFAQALHGLTFGITFLACASFIARRVPEHAAARGQGLLATLSTACLSIATFASGQLFDTWGSGVYWVMAGLCTVSFMLIGASYRFAFGDS